MALEAGQQAPDFELKDQTGQPVKLSDYQGKKAVVLVFYPFTFTGTCQAELCSIRDSIETFQNDDVQTLAVSCDTPFSHKVWAEQQGYQFPLLADFWPHGTVATAYGVFNEALGAAERGTFVIDKDGTIVYSIHNGLGEARDNAAYVDALKKVGAIA